MNGISTFCRGHIIRLIALLALLALVLPLVATSVDAQDSRSAYWKSFDTDITVQTDGTFHVVETQVVSFSGTFRFGSRDVPLDRVEGIENIQVSVGNDVSAPLETYTETGRDREEIGTYYLSESRQDTNIKYYFDPTRGTQDRVIVIEYDVIGGLRVYPDESPANQQLWWTGVSSDVTNSATVESATITVTLPESVDTNDTVWQPANADTDGRTWTWTRTNLPAGSVFDARLQFPSITTAAVPAWQQRDDEQRAVAEKQDGKNAVAGTVYLGVGLLLAVGGSLLIVLRWYSSGRDPKTGLVAEILSEPPDDLNPGAAGTLIDEKADTEDVIATLVDLGRRGIIRIQEEKTEGFMGFGGNTHYAIHLLTLDKPMQDYERNLLDAIFPGMLTVGDVIRMDKANERMKTNAAKIHAGFYAEVVAHGYFDESPDKVRSRAGMMGVFGPIVAVVVWLLMSFGYGGQSGWLWFMAFAAVFVYFLGSVLGQAMVRKTEAGAEAAAKWRAFKRYLEDIEKRTNLEESQDIFERYLPYAVAFGIESGWVTKFESAGAQTPTWFGTGGPVIIGSSGSPFGQRRSDGTWVQGGSPSAPGQPGSGGGWNIPDLQSGSDSAARGLGGASTGLLGMLGTAAKILSDSSGGGGGFGGGGGGFGGGGSSGGGGGGGGSSFG